ncbi:MAG TPA: 4-hydroxy-tetrahydrodipicolinate synthase [Candidatus Cloacimonadota bacterium]|nr:4-hydroxy-tetrahydrodipicolinate synthase [Candidatus Cloacimonadota bacterium]HPT71120.1 4-hydroxy-tetrahydrodipicolinate synthase [Candidatus Cloacimonadota bacterium]
MLQGSYVALITPFKHNEVDYNALEKLLDFHLHNNTDGMVLLGTTAETASLANDEKERILAYAMKHLDHKMPIMIGTGTYNLHQTIANTLRAQELGADYALIVTPYYVKPTQEGLYQYYKTIAEKVQIPIVLYNVPGRTSVNITSETTVRLARDFKNIVGIKEASGNLVQVSEIVRDAPKDFVVLSGEDALNMPIMACGGKGTVSVTANILPDMMHKLITACLHHHDEEALKLHLELVLMNQLMFIETSPIPVKTALGMMGLITPDVRLPLYSLKDENKGKVEAGLKKMKLI